MVIKNILLSALVLCCSNIFATEEGHIQTFVVTAVGASEYSHSVYINTKESAEKSVCTNKKHFKLKLDNDIADKFYDAALLAFTHNKKFHIRYQLGKCIDGSVLPTAFMVE